MPKLKTESSEPKTESDFRAPGSNARALLFSTVERFERLQEEKEAIAEDQKEIMAEAKSSGLDTATIRRVISRRKKDKADLQEMDATLELYEHSLMEAEKAQIMQSQEDGE